MGDFNAVKGAHERISPSPPSPIACREFCSFISVGGFIEDSPGQAGVFSPAMLNRFWIGFS